MTTTELLSHLRRQNITVRADNGQIILNGPKGALTSTLRAELMQRKAEVLAFLNTAATLTRPKERSLEPVSRNGNLPLSYSQQRLWFLDQYEPDSSVYNVASAVRLKGRLDSGALEQSLKEIVKRHESLRTTFSVVEGEPVQVIAPSVEHTLDVADLREGVQSEREEQGQRVCEEEARRPFELGRGPLFRSLLIRLGEDDHILLLTMHHIVSDGWSMGVLNRELTVLYRAFCNGECSPLTPLPIQYGDYAAWQREWMKGEVLESQLRYWKKQLEGMPAVLNLPTDRARPAVQSFRGNRQTLELSKELTEGLKELSRKRGVTLYMTLLAAFQTLLYRYTGQEDIVVGSPIANRNRTEIEGLIGFFVNTLVLHSNFSDNPTFKELLARVREMALGAYAHQDLPFEKLVEELKPERSLSHSPLFQAMFVLQNAPSRQRELEGVTVSQVRLDNDTTKFDLSLALSEQSGAIEGSLEYSTDLFDASTMDRMSGYFQTLIKGIVADPQRAVTDLPMLTEAEKHQLLIEWNDTKRDYPREKCIHQLFEARVEKSPEAIAVVFEEEQLTYEELNQRANRVAHYLQKHGVKAETVVGICVERSVEMIIGLLGIIKAGGAYVPLDPSYPKERLSFMLEDTQTPVLITQRRLLETLPVFDGKMVCLDGHWGEISKESSNNLDTGTIAENLAYVIYTSGSTGQPKGVQVPHHAVINVLTHASEALGLSEHDTVPLVANICFDISAFELFLPLILGGRLIVASAHVAIDGVQIEQMLMKCGVTVMHATPATWRLLLQAGWKGVGNLKLLSGGEALQNELATQLRAKGSSVWNFYGPTETAIYSAAAETQPESNVGKISIGRPIANTEIYILDDHLEPVPIGVPGQLHIGGEGLARGYLRRPDLTAEKFIPAPLGKDPGARLYRTGDLARYLPDGNIEFLGRIDHQVKIRGFRIELGEIESVLSQHPAVRESVVLALEKDPGDKSLVAYVVPRQSPAPATTDLRSFLKQKLPEYMVPSAFVLLNALPLTANAKVDRKSLPALEQHRPELTQRYVAPRTPVEELLVEIWAEILKLETVGIHDNFFDLGGHSLLAMQVNSRIREALQVDLPLRLLFEAPTVAELATNIDQSSSTSRALRELARQLAEVEALSDEEIERQLYKEDTQSQEAGNLLMATVKK